MSIYTVIGDPHLKPNNIDLIQKLVNQIEDIGNPAIWLGDLLDTKEIIRGKCLNFWYDYFSSSKLNHIILVGNHDFHNLECKDHSLRVLDILENVKIVDDYYQLNNMVFLPYVHDQKLLKKHINKGKSKDILFGHLEVKSFDFGNGHICDSGLSKSFIENKYKLIISGHFHKYQKSKNFIYLGTPFSHTFGESNQTKYLMELNSKTLEYRLLKTNFPKHITIEINCDQYNQEELLDYKNDSLNSDNYYRLILKGLEKNIKKFNKDKYLSNSDLNIKIIERLTDEFMDNISIDETADNLTKFKEWASEIKRLDLNTTNLGVRILEAIK